METTNELPGSTGKELGGQIEPGENGELDVDTKSGIGKCAVESTMSATPVEETKTPETNQKTPEVKTVKNIEALDKIVRLGTTGIDYIFSHMADFPGLTPNAFANILIDSYCRAEDVVKNLKRFEGAKYDDIIMKLLDDTDFRHHPERINLDGIEITWSDDSIKKLLDQRNGYFIYLNIKKFNMSTDYLHYANMLAYYGCGWIVFHSPEVFPLKLDERKDIEDKVVSDFKNYNIADDYVKGFNQEDQVRFADKLIASGSGKYVASSLEKYNKFDKSDQFNVATKLIQGGEGESVADNFEKFDKFNKNDQSWFAGMLMGSSEGESVVSNLQKFDKFNTEDQKNVVDILVRNGQGRIIIKHLELFDKISNKNKEEIIYQIIEADKDIKDIYSEIDIERSRDTKDFLLDQDILNGPDGENRLDYDIVSNIERLVNIGMDKRQIAIKLCNTGKVDSVVYHIYKFDHETHNFVANFLLDNGMADKLVKKISGFNELTIQVASKLDALNRLNDVINHVDESIGNITFKITDAERTNFTNKYIDSIMSTNK